MVKPWKTDTASINDTKQWIEKHPTIGLAGHRRDRLSQKAVELLFEMSQQHVEHTRPSFQDTWLQVSIDIAKRSPDAETQVGTVIVSDTNHVLSVGYNGWMPHIDDSLIPNVRPDKHSWVIHSELSAILHCEHKPRGATLYCTHLPCLQCFFACVAAGIKEIIYIKGEDTTNTKGKDTYWEVAQFLARKQITIRGVDFTPNK